MQKKEQQQTEQNIYIRAKTKIMPCCSTITIQKGGSHTKTWLMILAIILIIARPANAECDIIDEQTVFINATSYCEMKFCSFASISICYQYRCEDNQECSVQYYSTSDLNCDVVCCKNIGAFQNRNASRSKKYCAIDHSNYSESGVTTTYNTIAIIIFSAFGAIFLIIVVLICCKRYASRRRAMHNNMTNSVAANGVIIAPSQINLNDYKIDEEGPYLINIYNQCAICLQTNVNLRTHCNHFYHGICLFQWFKKNSGLTCPLCMSKNTNPVKVYCKKCFAGDKLILFNGNIRTAQVGKIDDHKCELCKNGPNDDNLTFYDGSEYKSNKGEKTPDKKNDTQALQNQKKKKQRKQEKVIVQDQLQNSNKKLNQDQI